MRGVIFDPDYWHELAAKTRASAQRMALPAAQRLLLDTAAGYEKLADKARRRRACDGIAGNG